MVRVRNLTAVRSGAVQPRAGVGHAEARVVVSRPLRKEDGCSARHRWCPQLVLSPEREPVARCVAQSLEQSCPALAGRMAMDLPGQVLLTALSSTGTLQVSEVTEEALQICSVVNTTAHCVKQSNGVFHRVFTRYFTAPPRQ